MGHRVLQIKNYKNLGIKEKEELLLNVSTDKGELGGIVLLVGPNNSGKTNVLTALTAMNDPKAKNFSDSDLPDFDMTKPELEVSIVNYDDQLVYGFNKKYHNSLCKNEYFVSKNGKTNFYNVQGEMSQNAKSFISQYINLIKSHLRRGYSSNVSDFNEVFQSTNETNLSYDGDRQKMHDRLNQLYQSPNYNINFVRNNFGTNMTEVDVMNHFDELLYKNNDVIDEIEKQKKFDILPAISLYKPLNFKNVQLQVTPNDIGNSDLFKLVFKAIEFNIEELKTTYQRVKEQGMPGLLRSTNNAINEKLSTLSEQFNKLFQSNANKYKFEITLETNSIFLVVSLNDTVLHLDKQSTGFKWFFEFYFTLMAANNLKRGDIIVMDEPATNLHTSGVVELRKFIKTFAESNELTFVISTHNPFFVDLNYLEEVRVVNRIGEYSKIQSKFHFLDEEDDTDSLRPIKEALTVPRHVLVDPNVSTIFVEGITDYLYLTAFTQLLKVKDYIFLPIQGVMKKNLFETLSKIEKHPIILVDSDNAGKQIKERAEKSKYNHIEVISLSDIDSSFTVIESLFDPTERLEKSFNNAATFKNRLLKKTKISAVTRSNFEKLLKNIQS